MSAYTITKKGALREVGKVLILAISHPCCEQLQGQSKDSLWGEKRFFRSEMLSLHSATQVRHVFICPLPPEVALCHKF